MTTNAEVQKLRAKGKSYAQIADSLGLSPSTVYRWVNPRQAELDRKGHRERRRHNIIQTRDRERRSKAARRAARNNPNAEPTQARTCRCEKPWHTREPVCDGSYEDWCLACSREIR